MDLKLLFWTGALLNLGAILLCCGAGVRAIRRRDARRHKRLMLSASGLVAFFLVAYLSKVALAGREDRSAWTALDHGILYFHEACIAVMLLGGVYALTRARRFRGRLGRAIVLPPETDPLEGRVRHRRAGWAAVVGGTLAFATAIGVLGGMFARAS